MKRICSWCGRTLGIGPGPAELETHGICETCSARLEIDALVSDALMLLRTLERELERVQANIWPMF